MKPSFSQRKGSLQIIGTGASVPDPTYTTDNDTVLNKLREHGVDIGNKVGIDTQNLTGIARRSLEDRDSFDFALEASLRAIEAAKITDPNFSVDQLGIIVSGGSSPDWVYPACACKLQGALLGAESCEAFDISLACSSGIAGLSLGGSRMRDQGFKYGLIAFGESIATRSNTPTSMSNSLWGNAGGAFVVRYDPEGDARYGLFADTIISDGQYADWTKSVGIGAHPDNLGQAANASMEGHEKDIHRYGLRMVPGAIQKFLDENEITGETYLFPHNSNLKMMNNIGKEIGLSEDRVLSRITEQGNTSSASILTSLDYFVREGHFKKDDVLIFAAFGGGMAMALSLYRWPM